MNIFDQSLCMEKLDLTDCSTNIMKRYIKVDEINAKIA
jgi:hypothetical protein